MTNHFSPDNSASMKLVPDDLTHWVKHARRDDWYTYFVGSDIRCMLAEIERLRASVAQATVPVAWRWPTIRDQWALSSRHPGDDTDGVEPLYATSVAQTIGWQPIETFDHALAFKGVLVVDRGHVGEAYYDGESDSWWLANTSEHDFDACHAIYPTHWMPLPAGPTPLSSTLCAPVYCTTDGAQWCEERSDVSRCPDCPLTSKQCGED